MGHESNPAGVSGANNPGRSADWFKQRGASDSQAAEAAAAAKRAQSGGSRS
ncbi:hypothetical protein [Stakelama tenebrarum]|uniref:Uncharacterized protein n=1 Tax=Stakelama tenebrarum TaxID=2711215 RepID=A0A6G6Y3W2_9SPHN|nr:hypothetical protein [Sphingosinithalassobacter tenebrarum]QIG79634.1 hypothetical protein G5C33_07410 [Sphingosinithalassobacter tenebrarum]